MAIENSNREIRMESLSEAEETRNTAAEEIGAKQTEVEENVTPATAASMQTPAEDGASAPSQTCAAQEPAAASDATAGGAVAEEPASGVAETDAKEDGDAEPESAEAAEPDTEEADEESSGAVSEDDLSGKSKEELVDMFARMLETEPVQTLRKSMEAIKVAFYKLHRAEVEAACRKAALDGFINSLPKGYDTPVGELGGALSGGERQRIGVARAFLHDAPFLLLDEPTSNLDSLNEGIILKAVRDECREKTVLLVSHRRSTMAVADLSFSVESGRLS